MAIVGSSIVVGKVAVARLPVFLLSGLRFAVASAILVTLVLLVERPLPRPARRDVAVLALQAFAGIFAFNVLLLYGLRLTSAAEGGIVTSTTPAVAAALAVLTLGERWSRARTLGVALAVVGVLALNTAAAASGRVARGRCWATCSSSAPSWARGSSWCAAAWPLSVCRRWWWRRRSARSASPCSCPARCWRCARFR